MKIYSLEPYLRAPVAEIYSLSMKIGPLLLACKTRNWTGNTLTESSNEGVLILRVFSNDTRLH